MSVTSMAVIAYFTILHMGGITFTMVRVRTMRRKFLNREW